LVQISIHGAEQEFGLRLDLQKQVFLDPLEESAVSESALERAAPDIVQFLYGVGHPETTQIYSDSKAVLGARQC